MAIRFNVEDGSAMPDSNAFCDLTYLNDYADTYAKTFPVSVTDPQKQVAIILATRYISTMYRMIWRGTIRLATQALSWPRIGVVIEGNDTVQFDDPRLGTPVFNGFPVPYNVVPDLVKQATCELAFKLAQLGGALDDLSPDLDAGTTGITSDEVGPLKTSWEHYVPVTQFRAVDALLAPLLQSNTFTLELVRA